MFEKLSEMFPGSKYFEVLGFTHADAMEKCARLSIDGDHVIEINGKVAYITNHDISPDIGWLVPVLDPSAPSE